MWDEIKLMLKRRKVAKFERKLAKISKKRDQLSKKAARITHKREAVFGEGSSAIPS